MKHLNFKETLSKSGKTKNIDIISLHDDSVLGYIQWSGAWRKYVFIPTIKYQTQWSHDCLEDLRHFIVQLNKEQKEKHV